MRSGCSVVISSARAATGNAPATRCQRPSVVRCSSKRPSPTRPARRRVSKAPRGTSSPPRRSRLPVMQVESLHQPGADRAEGPHVDAGRAVERGPVGGGVRRGELADGGGRHPGHASRHARGSTGRRRPRSRRRRGRPRGPGRGRRRPRGSPRAASRPAGRRRCRVGSARAHRRGGRSRCGAGRRSRPDRRAPRWRAARPAASATCTTDIWLTSGLEPRHTNISTWSRSGTGCTSESPYISVETWNLVLTSMECEAKTLGRAERLDEARRHQGAGEGEEGRVALVHPDARAVRARRRGRAPARRSRGWPAPS